MSRAGRVGFSLAAFVLAVAVAGPRVGWTGAGLAEPLAAQEPERRLARAFPDSLTLAALAGELDAAEEAGLPLEPLVQKALEGHSKGASDALVVEAVRALRDRLATASTILGPDAEETELVAAAGALYLGVDRSSLARVVEETPHEAVPMALVVLGDLVKRGVDVALAHRVLLSLGQAGADAATLAGFREQVESDIRTGVTPGRAAEVRSRGIVLSLGRGGGPPGGTGS